jgi:hypothetical protein
MSANLNLAAAMKERKGIVCAAAHDPSAPAPTDAAKIARRKGGRRRYSSGRQYALQLEARAHDAEAKAEKAKGKLASLRAELDALSETNRELKRLYADAEARAGEAKAALVAVEHVKETNDKVWRLNQEIARLRGRNHDAAVMNRDEKLIARLTAELYTLGRKNQTMGGHCRALEKALVSLRLKFSAEKAAAKLAAETERDALQAEIKKRDYENGLAAKLAAQLRESGRMNMQLNGRRQRAELRITDLEAENEQLRNKLNGETV